MKTPYFKAFENRRPRFNSPMTPVQRRLWHGLAGVSAASGALYLHWRWTTSLNPDALLFSALVAGAETLFYLGALLFTFDIWEEGDTPQRPPPKTREAAGLDGAAGPIAVDVFITTYDEPPEVVAPSVQEAKAVQVPEGVRMRIWLLDDGNRAQMADLAARENIGYFARDTNEGFKAGNLRNGLLQTSGDFVVICDADTRLFPSFLNNTLGYFCDPQVAWVQTPHWFYDLPEGQPWAAWLAQHLRFSPKGALARRGGAAMTWITGRTYVGSDPFMSDPAIFFDVIQRRRNRNGAAFCCGAGSIHRREAVFDAALKRKACAVGRLEVARAPAGLTVQDQLRAVPLEPYKFHVSEDLYTSILLHEESTAGWRSVYHPQVESRMLSPMSLEAWAGQRLKYAGGSFDIALRDNPLWRRGLSWQQKLHYGATFWSYISLLWAPILLLAPMVSLITGVTPVKAYTVDFFVHFLPAVLAGELAMLWGCKGHGLGAGRVLSVAVLPVHMRALYCVLSGQRPGFAPTPKLPMSGAGRRHVVPHLLVIAAMSAAAAIGIWRTWSGDPGFSPPLLVVNLFWLMCNMILVARLPLAALSQGAVLSSDAGDIEAALSFPPRPMRSEKEVFHARRSSI
ncbi:glycosyltransferase [Shimia sp. R11_0]|uniref:glycosyltransferase family 2 protein n=1 Tax=Shimia sp. R11_0 TaxID=2821096 RepID=UPI001ADCD545|nr:cellulose synthase catalytic subunit [Shimia sp. R11_0]MBO9478210.1 glycosyltransferase [Shimia sp. R11_0]